MKAWCGKLYVAKMARTCEESETASRAAKERSVTELASWRPWHIHILLVVWSQARVIETADVWTVQVIKQHRVRDLFDGDAANLVRG
jgi:hypothetical protein